MTLMQSEGLIEVQDQQEMLAILGRNDELLRVIQECYDAKIVARGNVISFSGSEEEVKQLENLLRNCCFWSVRALPLPRTMCVTAYA